MKIIKKAMAKMRLKDEKLEKELATINEEPWVKVISVTMADPKDPSTGFFELDWNEKFVDSLIESGYSGRTAEETVDMWFNDLCRGVISNEFEEGT